jgi:hypothetical protein
MQELAQEITFLPNSGASELFRLAVPARLFIPYSGGSHPAQQHRNDNRRHEGPDNRKQSSGHSALALSFGVGGRAFVPLHASSLALLAPISLL